MEVEMGLKSGALLLRIGLKELKGLPFTVPHEAEIMIITLKLHMKGM
jgi:hypothetical protein